MNSKSLFVLIIYAFPVSHLEFTKVTLEMPNISHRTQMTWSKILCDIIYCVSVINILNYVDNIFLNQSTISPNFTMSIYRQNRCLLFPTNWGQQHTSPSCHSLKNLADVFIRLLMKHKMVAVLSLLAGHELHPQGVVYVPIAGII